MKDDSRYVDVWFIPYSEETHTMIAQDRVYHSAILSNILEGIAL